MTTKELAAKLDHVVASMMRDKEAVMWWISDISEVSRALSADRGEAVWSYCPECGSDELHHAEGVHKQCKRCKQEWFSDVDYTRAVRANLGERMDRKEATPPSPSAEAVEVWQDGKMRLERRSAAPSGVSDARRMLDDIERAVRVMDRMPLLQRLLELRQYNDVDEPMQVTVGTDLIDGVMYELRDTIGNLQAAQPQPGRVEGMRAEVIDILFRLETMQPPNVVLQQITMLGEMANLLRRMFRDEPTAGGQGADHG
jgi:hypothetical protein